jgi:hypothetical protein
LAVLDIFEGRKNGPPFLKFEEHISFEVVEVTKDIKRSDGKKPSL